MDTVDPIMLFREREREKEGKDENFQSANFHIIGS